MATELQCGQSMRIFACDKQAALPHVTVQIFRGLGQKPHPKPGSGSEATTGLALGGLGQVDWSVVVAVVAVRMM